MTYTELADAAARLLATAATVVIVVLIADIAFSRRGRQ